eukprot:1196435-Prorocentrum_minimum.AAC.4
MDETLQIPKERPSGSDLTCTYLPGDCICASIAAMHLCQATRLLTAGVNDETVFVYQQARCSLFETPAYFRAARVTYILNSQNALNDLEGSNAKLLLT